MLTFTLYYLLKNLEAMRRLREEVDTMIGDRPMSVDDLQKLPYLIGTNPILIVLRPLTLGDGCSGDERNSAAFPYCTGADHFTTGGHDSARREVHRQEG